MLFTFEKGKLAKVSYAPLKLALAPRKVVHHVQVAFALVEQYGSGKLWPNVEQ